MVVVEARPASAIIAVALTEGLPQQIDFEPIPQQNDSEPTSKHASAASPATQQNNDNSGSHRKGPRILFQPEKEVLLGGTEDVDNESMHISPIIRGELLSVLLMLAFGIVWVVTVRSGHCLSTSYRKGYDYYTSSRKKISPY